VSLSKLPSGRWRAQVHSPELGRNVSVSKILGKGYESFPDKASAKAARELARAQLGNLDRSDTVGGWYQTWTTDPLYRRPKLSTDLHNHERVKAFCDEHKDLQLRLVDDFVVARWLSGGKKNSQVPALRAMFNDAMSAKAGRLIDRNPFARLGIKKSTGNARKHPPSEQLLWSIIGNAHSLSSPAYAAWLQVGAFTGLRPGELDGLRWPCVDFAADRIRVITQFNAKTRTFTLPKNGEKRDALLTPKAREALEGLPRDSEFVFTNLRGNHFTASARAFQWKPVASTAGWGGSCYLATRHFFGWYATNVLLLPSEDVALLMGHTDGGELVRKLYGHRSVEDTFARGQAAFGRVGELVDLDAKRKDAS
jgi:integrase